MAESHKLDFLTTEQVATYACMSASFFEKRRWRKHSPSCLKLGGRVCCRKSTIDQWLNEQVCSEGDINV